MTEPDAPELDLAALFADPDAEMRRAACEHWWARGYDGRGRPEPVVLHWEAVRDALTDRRLSPRSFAEEMVDNGIAPRTANQVAPLFSLHGDEHLRQRRILTGAFTARRVERLRPATAGIAGRLADAIADDGGRCEFVADFAEPLPPEVFAELFGLPPQDAPRLAEWATGVSLAFGSPLTEEQVATVEAAAAGLRAYAVERIAVARAEPGDDLVTRLLRSDDDGECLDDEQVIAMITGFVFAGAETTRRQLTSGVMVLAEHPDEWERLAADPARAPAVVEEVLRHSGIIPGLTRRAECPYEREGLALDDGDRLVLAFGTANRDPLRFDDPHRFDPDREDAGAHVTFGWGPHHCVGAGLARMEMTEALRVLTARFGPPVVEEVGPSSGLLAPDHLRVRFPLR